MRLPLRWMGGAFQRLNRLIRLSRFAFVAMLDVDCDLVRGDTNQGGEGFISFKV